MRSALSGGDLFGGGEAGPGPVLAVGAAGLISALAVWVPTQSLALAAGFAGAGLLAGAVLRALPARALPADPAMADQHDWSLVRAVADQDGRGIAITDRAGRLVCANGLYCDWFGGAVTPPGLPVDAGTNALLADAGRIAWRDGEAAVAAFHCGDREITGTVSRVGRASDHLMWCWQHHRVHDPVAEAIAKLNGHAGRALSDAGVMAAVTTATGTIRAANAALRLRAGGAVDASLEGQDFAVALRVDSAGLIRFAREREGEGATPLRIVEVAFDSASPASPLLLMLIDEDGGAGERGIAFDYVESLLASLPFGIAMVDRDGRFRFTNPAFMRAAKVPSGEAVSYPGDLVVSEDKAAIGDAIRRHAAGRGTSGEIGVRLRGEPERSVTLGLVGIRGLGDAAVLLTLKDEGGDAELSRHLAQATKMQAVGHLAGGIAHDFNNILTAVLGSCDLMLMRHTPGDSDYDDIQHIRSNANRAANLVRQLLAFSRQQTLRPVIINLSDVIADVSHLLERLIGDSVKLVVQHGRGLGPVRADPVQLEQVVINLAVNARDAMPGGGTLTIATSAVGPGDLPAAPGQEEMAAGDYCLLTVSDTGSGIPPELLPRIFDPFFTTKDVGKGTGLGLATVYGIVKQTGGYIFAETEAGRGSRFSIYLPVHHGVEADGRPPSPPASGARSLHWGSGTILLVEDEEMVRAVAERALTRAGYTVVTAVQGEDGLEKFAELAEIDLIVSDVMMPQMDGPAMVREIRRRRPDMPVLFMSGYAEEQLRESITLSNVSFLSKPFSVAQLVDAVAAIQQASG